MQQIQQPHSQSQQQQQPQTVIVGSVSNTARMMDSSPPADLDALFSPNRCMAMFIIGFILFPAWFIGAYVGLRSKLRPERLWGYANTLMAFFFTIIVAPVLIWAVASERW
ncbi:hypothetical protein BDR26DRAFT_874940 [Obelidium mucronatum]|nr:hypothetical protein BDR26DRAFT_874940 [Obelidium mucronatum]